MFSFYVVDLVNVTRITNFHGSVISINRQHTPIQNYSHTVKFQDSHCTRNSDFVGLDDT